MSETRHLDSLMSSTFHDAGQSYVYIDPYLPDDTVLTSIGLQLIVVVSLWKPVNSTSIVIMALYPYSDRLMDWSGKCPVAVIIVSRATAQSERKWPSFRERTLLKKAALRMRRQIQPKAML